MTDTPSIEYPDYPFRGESLIDRKPLFENALSIENEEIEKKFDCLEKMARYHNDLVYKEAERVSQDNPKREVCGLLKEDGVDFAGDEHYGVGGTEDFLPSDKIRKLSQDDAYIFHTHPVGTSTGLSGQDIFGAYISLGEIIFTEPEQGQRIALLVCPTEKVPFDDILTTRESLWYEAENISSHWGTFQHSEFGILAKEKLKVRVKEIKLNN